MSDHEEPLLPTHIVTKWQMSEMLEGTTFDAATRARCMSGEFSLKRGGVEYIVQTENREPVATNVDTPDDAFERQLERLKSLQAACAPHRHANPQPAFAPDAGYVVAKMLAAGRAVSEPQPRKRFTPAEADARLEAVVRINLKESGVSAE